VSDTDRGRIRVTASIGAAQLNGPTSAPGSAEQLLEDADRALYAAKARGRDRIVLAWSD
jgi:PleD family two-component response regulator